MVVPRLKIGGITFLASSMVACLALFRLLLTNRITMFTVGIYGILLIVIGLVFFIFDYTKHGGIIQAILFSILTCVCIYFDPGQFSGYISLTAAIILILKHAKNHKLYLFLLVLAYVATLTIRAFTHSAIDIISSIISIILVGFLIGIISTLLQDEVIKYARELRDRKARESVIAAEKDMLSKMEQKTIALTCKAYQYKNAYNEVLEISKELIRLSKERG